MEAIQVLGCHNLLGEGPLWSTAEQALYWVDIAGKSIHRYWPDSGKHESFAVDAEVGVIAFREAGGFVAAGKTGFYFWDVGHSTLEPISDPESDKAESRFNDGKVDRAGRFWAGTMTEEGASSALYRMDADLKVQRMESGITISNGIGWSPDNRTMYYADSMHYVIYAYDYDLGTGAIANRRNFIEIEPTYGIPDGLTVDSEGYIWCALFNGSKVTRFDPQGKIDVEIALPVTQVTCCAFGGKDYSDLYVTSAGAWLSEEQQKAQPQAGDLFVIKTNVRGLPEPKFAG